MVAIKITGVTKHILGRQYNLHTSLNPIITILSGDF